MNAGGVLEVHDNVTFEANAAQDGGAVSLHFEIGSHLPVVVRCDRIFQGRFDSEAVDQAPLTGLMIELQSRGSLDGSAPFFSLTETPESRTQVNVGIDGVLKVHDNVVLRANTAGSEGGAVSLPFEIGSHLPVVAL